MKFIFEVYNNSVKGIVEVEARDDQDAILQITKMGLKFSSMRPPICIYKIQYAMVDHKRWIK